MRPHDRPFAPIPQAGQRPEEGTLARTVRPGNQQMTAGQDFEIQVLDQFTAFCRRAEREVVEGQPRAILQYEHLPLVARRRRRRIDRGRHRPESRHHRRK